MMVVEGVPCTIKSLVFRCLVPDILECAEESLLDQLCAVSRSLQENTVGLLCSGSARGWIHIVYATVNTLLHCAG